MRASASTNADLDQARREYWVVVAITVLSIWPRFRGFGRMGLNHFDEGIYAFSGLWAFPVLSHFTIDPQLAPYAPPVFAFFIGLSYSLIGISDSAALLVPAFLGVLTVPMAGWVARRTFGPGAGAAAAAFIALSMAHIAFSRKALTDVPFLLAWLGVMAIGSRFLEQATCLRAIALGLTVGLAQNIKYNGWLGFLVIALAALFGVASDSTSRRPLVLLRTFGLGFVAVLVAGVCYWPWYQFIERHGGYADLVRHHRSYLSGPQAWLPHWKSQLAQSVALSGSAIWPVVAWTTAWIGAGVAVNGPRLTLSYSRWNRAQLRVGGLLGIALLVAIPDVAWWVGLTWIGRLAVDRRPARRVLAAWWLVFSVMTPFYHPYARLWLPLHAAGWVFLAGLVVELGPFVARSFATSDQATMSRPKVLTRSAFAFAILLVSWLHWGGDRPRPLPDSFVFAPSDGFRTAAASLSELAEDLPKQRSGLRVLARRPLAFYLALRGFGPFRILPGRDEIFAGPTAEWVLIDSVQFGASLDEGATGSELLRRWRPVASWDLSLDAVTELDVKPDASYGTHAFDKPRLVLLAPRVMGQPAPVKPTATIEPEIK